MLPVSIRYKGRRQWLQWLQIIQLVSLVGACKGVWRQRCGLADIYLVTWRRDDKICFSCHGVVHRGMDMKEKRTCWWVPVETPK